MQLGQVVAAGGVKSRLLGRETVGKETLGGALVGGQQRGSKMAREGFVVVCFERILGSYV